MVKLQSSVAGSISYAVRINHSSMSRHHSLSMLFRIVATIIAPTPFVAALFIILSKITQKLGVQYSRLSPRWCE